MASLSALATVLNKKKSKHQIHLYLVEEDVLLWIQSMCTSGEVCLRGFAGEVLWWCQPKRKGQTSLQVEETKIKSYSLYHDIRRSQISVRKRSEV